VILLSGAICYVGGVHFNGILDVHIGYGGPLWLYMAEGLFDWLCMVLALQLLGAMVAPARFRFIDMLGTQALARWPYLVVACVSLLPGFSRTMTYLAETAKKTEPAVTVSGLDVTVTITVVLVTLAAMILMVLLMYRSYVTATAVTQQRKKIISFIVALLCAEVTSVIVCIILADRAGILKRVAQ
jgi:hypothetical protein